MTLLKQKGLTLVELAVTLLIFSIIAIIALPSFEDLIARSRIKTQTLAAANFMRSAQELAISGNRPVYIYTNKIFDNAVDTDGSYWYDEWIMAYAPLGVDYTLDRSKLLNKLKDTEANYLIAKQKIFSPIISKKYKFFVAWSLEGNDSLLYPNGVTKKGKLYDTSYAYVSGKPSFMRFYPSGIVEIPAFGYWTPKKTSAPTFPITVTKPNFPHFLPFPPAKGSSLSSSVTSFLKQIQDKRLLISYVGPCSDPSNNQSTGSPRMMSRGIGTFSGSGTSEGGGASVGSGEGPSGTLTGGGGGIGYGGGGSWTGGGPGGDPAGGGGGVGGHEPGGDGSVIGKKAEKTGAFMSARIGAFINTDVVNDSKMFFADVPDGGLDRTEYQRLQPISAFYCYSKHRL